MTRDNNPSRGDDGARAEAEMKEREAIGPELKPCPFCGGTDISVDKAGNASHYFCTCNDCDVVQDYDHNYTRDDAIAVWNRRAAPAHPAPQGDDGLAERLRNYGLSHMKGMPSVIDEATSALRSQASEIAGLKENVRHLEIDCRQWSADYDERGNTLSAERQLRKAAEAKLASAMEALEQISTGPMFTVTDVSRWVAWAAKLARTTLSSIKGAAE